MAANLISIVFNINIIFALIIALILSASYLVKGGFRSNVYADAFQFFVMFAGFIVIVIVSATSFGGFEFLQTNLPSSHLSITCLLYTSDAADERSSVDLGGRRIIKKKNNIKRCT